MKIKALDHMLKNDLFFYLCDPWYVQPGPKHYFSVMSKRGQVNYKGEVFLITHNEIARFGRISMAMGAPDNIIITRARA